MTHANALLAAARELWSRLKCLFCGTQTVYIWNGRVISPNKKIIDKMNEFWSEVDNSFNRVNQKAEDLKRAVSETPLSEEGQDEKVDRYVC